MFEYVDDLLYAFMRRARGVDQANQIYALLWKIRVERVNKVCCFPEFNFVLDKDGNAIGYIEEIDLRDIPCSGTKQ